MNGGADGRSAPADATWVRRIGEPIWRAPHQTRRQAIWRPRFKDFQRPRAIRFHGQLNTVPGVVEPAELPAAGIVIDLRCNLKTHRLRPVEEERNPIKRKRKTHSPRLDIGLLESPERQGAIRPGCNRKGIELCALSR